jgi:hypothetical protein
MLTAHSGFPTEILFAFLNSTKFRERSDARYLQTGKRGAKCYEVDQAIYPTVITLSIALSSSYGLKQFHPVLYNFIQLSIMLGTVSLST